MNAQRYTLGTLWAEKEIATRRVNERMASDATISKTAQAAIHGGKKGHNLFQEMMKKLTGK